MPKNGLEIPSFTAIVIKEIQIFLVAIFLLKNFLTKSHVLLSNKCKMFDRCFKVYKNESWRAALDEIFQAILNCRRKEEDAFDGRRTDKKGKSS